MSSTSEYEQQQFWNYDHKNNKILYDIIYKRMEEVLQQCIIKNHSQFKKLSEDQLIFGESYCHITKGSIRRIDPQSQEVIKLNTNNENKI